MSYTAPDFADEAAAILNELGYSIDQDWKGHWYWLLGNLAGTGRYDEYHLALADAMRHMRSSLLELQSSAASVVGRWERGDLAGAVHWLELSLKSSFGDADIAQFVKEHS